MMSSSEDSEKNANSVHHVREDSEYVRLVISNETNTVEADVLQSQSEAGAKSFWWWIKALALCLVTIILLLIFLKWGVPFLFEKVLLINSWFLGLLMLVVQVVFVLFTCLYFTRLLG